MTASSPCAPATIDRGPTVGLPFPDGSARGILGPMTWRFDPWNDTVGYLLARWRDERSEGSTAFDRSLGVETARWTLGGYEPTPVEAFGPLLDAAPVPCDGATFVDAGAGKGRTLLLAARHPYARVVGIELDPALVAIGQANLRAAHDPARRCDDLGLLHADATTVRWPTGPLHVYLYNPFDGDALDAMLQGLEASLAAAPRPCALAYLNPTHRDRLDVRGWRTAASDGEGIAAWVWFLPPAGR